jgi:hypothetical protein
MTSNGRAALAERLHEQYAAALCVSDLSWHDWEGCDSKHHWFSYAATILGEHGEFLPAGRAPAFALEALENMAWQFAYYNAGTLTTGGLSALEEAFEVLGWDDPHPAPGRLCDEPDCTNEGTCGWPSPTGYRQTCFGHTEEGKHRTSSESGGSRE